MHIQNLVKFLQLVLKILSGNDIILTSVKGHNSVTNVQNIMCKTSQSRTCQYQCKNKYGKILSTSSQDTERKRKSDINAGPECCYKVRKAVKIRIRYNQVPHLTQDTTWKSDNNTIKHHKQEPKGQPFPSR